MGLTESGEILDRLAHIGLEHVGHDASHWGVEQAAGQIGDDL